MAGGFLTFYATTSISFFSSYDLKKGVAFVYGVSFDVAETLATGLRRKEAEQHVDQISESNKEDEANKEESVIERLTTGSRNYVKASYSKITEASIATVLVHSKFIHFFCAKCMYGYDRDRLYSFAEEIPSLMGKVAEEDI